MKSRLKPYQEFNLAKRLVPSNDTLINNTTGPVTVSTEIKRADLPKYLNSSTPGNDKFYVYRKSSMQGDSNSNPTCFASSTHLYKHASQSSHPNFNKNPTSVTQVSDFAAKNAEFTESMFEKRKTSGQHSKQISQIIGHFNLTAPVTNSLQITTNRQPKPAPSTQSRFYKNGATQLLNGVDPTKVCTTDKIQYSSQINSLPENINTLNGIKNVTKIRPSSRYDEINELEENQNLRQKNMFASCATEKNRIKDSSLILQISSQNAELTKKINFLETEIQSFKKVFKDWQTLEQNFCTEITKKQYQLKELNLAKTNLNEEIKFLQLKLTNQNEGKQRQLQQIKILNNLNSELREKNEELEKKINLQKECLECEKKKSEQIEDRFNSLLNLKMELDRYMKINRELEEKLEGQQQKIVELSFAQAQKENQLCLVKKNSCEEVESLKFEIKKFGVENERLKSQIRIKQSLMENLKGQLSNQTALSQKRISQIQQYFESNVKASLLYDLQRLMASVKEKFTFFEQRIENFAKKVAKISNQKLKQDKRSIQGHDRTLEIINSMEQKCKKFLSQINVGWKDRERDIQTESTIQAQAEPSKGKNNYRLESIMCNLVAILNISHKFYQENEESVWVINSKDQQIRSLENKLDNEGLEKLKLKVDLQESKNAVLELQEELENNFTMLKSTQQKLKQLQSVMGEEQECLGQICEELIKSRLSLLNLKYEEEGEEGE